MGRTSFVSWQSADLAWVRRFVEHLREVGLPVAWHPGDGRPGELWPLAISRAMEDAEFFLPVFSPEYFASRACEVELNAALAAEMTTRRNYVLPLLLREVRVPFLLAPFQRIDFRDPRRYAEGLRDVVGRVDPHALAKFAVSVSTRERDPEFLIQLVAQPYMRTLHLALAAFEELKRT